MGGFTILALYFIQERSDYLGLGVIPEFKNSITIDSAFHQGGADLFSWLWKMIYTSITLGTGFKGGEVTPLFFIGACLGNSLSILLHAPISLMAGLGFIALFSSSTKTPLASTLLGIELFGIQFVLFYLLVCYGSYWISGTRGIYTSQKIKRT